MISEDSANLLSTRIEKDTYHVREWKVIRITQYVGVKYVNVT